MIEHVRHQLTVYLLALRPPQRRNAPPVHEQNVQLYINISHNMLQLIPFALQYLNSPSRLSEAFCRLAFTRINGTPTQKIT